MERETSLPCSQEPACNAAIELTEGIEVSV
jgi:hypothetical protein